MVGLGEALSVVSLGIQLFEGCVKGYKIWYAAQHIGSDGDLLHTKLLVQYTRFTKWGRTVGLPDHPDMRLDWNTIILILGHQIRLLEQAEKLHRKYGLDAAAHDQRPQSSNQSKHQSVVEQVGPGGSAELVRETLEQLQIGDRRTSQTNAIRNFNSIYRRVAWGATDKAKLQTIVDEITGLNNQLIEYLHDVDQQQFRRDLDVVFREFIALCKDKKQLEAIEQSLPGAAVSVGAAAKVKKVRLAVNYDLCTDEVKTEATEQVKLAGYRHFASDKLLKKMEGEREGWRVAKYDQSVVLVEWRTIEADWDPILERLKALTILLTRAEDVTFHSLPCAGYGAIESEGKFGFVFDITSFATGGDHTSVQTRSLHDLLSEAEQVGSECRFVSMCVRMRIACDMAEAVTQLHTVGWLHKGIRSQNIRFVAPARSPPLEVVASRPHLVGYGYARQDTDDAAKRTELPDSIVDNDIYRHPNARGEDKAQFQKRFDLYGLACVLIELALWERLAVILQRYTLAPDPPPSLNELAHDVKFRRELSHYLTTPYLEAIDLCLHSSFDGTDSEGASIIEESEILNKIRSCAR